MSKRVGRLLTEEISYGIEGLLYTHSYYQPINRPRIIFASQYKKPQRSIPKQMMFSLF
jgi:hypothetical protein